MLIYYDILHVQYYDILQNISYSTLILLYVW